MAGGGSKLHHWWPRVLSHHWADESGGVTCLSSDGTGRRDRPGNFGAIGHGHSIKLGHQRGETTVFDQNFENEFDAADNSISGTLAFIEGLNFVQRPSNLRTDRFVANAISDGMFDRLVKVLISLAVRSPMAREACVSLAESMRGPLLERERNALIGLNLRDMYRRTAGAFRGRGKLAIIRSLDREFIFGDGFYHNLTSPAAPPHNPRILVPLTPRLSVLYVYPQQYMVEPRLSTLVIDDQEADFLNVIAQVYARKYVFFRSDRPVIVDAFARSEHLEFTGGNDPVRALMDDMPGMPPRDTSLDWLSAL